MAEYNNITPIYNALGKEMIDNLPILDLKNKMGHTGYIDFITSGPKNYIKVY